MLLCLRQILISTVNQISRAWFSLSRRINPFKWFDGGNIRIGVVDLFDAIYTLSTRSFRQLFDPYRFRSYSSVGSSYAATEQISPLLYVVYLPPLGDKLPRFDTGDRGKAMLTRMYRCVYLFVCYGR